MNTKTGQVSFWQSPVTWLAAIQLVAAYEWLVSGLNKVVAGHFPQQLHGIIADALHGNPNGWVVPALKGVVLPCCTLFGGMVECGEVLVGVVLAAGAVLWMLDGLPDRIRRLGMRVTAVACLGAAVMNSIFYVTLGGTFPAISPENAANEGVSIDVVLMLVMLALAAANLAQAPRRTPRSAPVPTAPPAPSPVRA